jgi:radical SAM protein with 4Fe4S-binding SPASM domain
MTANAKAPVSQTHDVAPRVIAWESTRACNFACVHCRAQAQKEADPKQLTTQEALGLVDQIAEFARPVFIISGGDPLQRKDIFEVASHASSRGLRVVMSPSGSNLTKDAFERMKASGVRMISLSLDGSTPEIHDNFRQVPGAFELAMKNMGLARQKAFPFRVNTTVTQHNLSDIFNIQKVAAEAGAGEWDVFMLVPTGRGKVKMEITPDQYEETTQSIYKASLTSQIPIKMTCAPQYTRVIAQQQKKSGQAHAGGRGCMAGNGFCFVSHIGEVYGCGFLPVPAGDIRQQRLKQIYQQSSLFVQLRNHESLKGKCGRCEYQVVCGGCRARALSIHNNYLEEEPYCIYKPKKS